MNHLSSFNTGTTPFPPPDPQCDITHTRTLSHHSSLSQCDQWEFNAWHSYMDIEGKRFC